MKKIINSPVSVGFTELRIIPNFQGIKGLNTHDLLKYHNIGKWAIIVTHNGNMGNNEESINKNLRIAFGADVTIKKIKKHCIKYSIEGSPDYSYRFAGLLNINKLTELEN